MDIQLRHASKTIKGARVLDDVEMHLQSGLVYGFHGINGSGKTMLMRLIAGLILPTSGQVLIDGLAAGRDMRFPGSMGLFLERPAFLGGYTGFENLEQLARLQGRVGPQEVRGAIARVGLDPDDRKKYRKYSLGMKQRLGIACAVMEEPELVILDEPTNSLDDRGVDMVCSLVAEQKARGALVILACHDRQLLELMADEIFALQSGRVVGHDSKTATQAI